MQTTLKTRIFFSFFGVLFLFNCSMGVIGFKIIDKNVVERAQKEVENKLAFARSVYADEIEKIGRHFALAQARTNPAELKEIMKLDYLFVLPKAAAAERSGIAAQVFKERKPLGGTRVIAGAELSRLGGGIAGRARIDLKATPRARPFSETVLDRAMAIEYAMPLRTRGAEVESVLVGGRIVNRNFELVDRIHNFVFENALLDGKPLGTVTIFLGDARIATNVLDREGRRAIGTKASAAVAEKVLEQGGRWLDRAFVVTDWYLTSYEPIRDFQGRIVGMLYVGVLEKPFVRLKRNLLLLFFSLLLAASLLALLVSYLIARHIARPIRNVVEAARRMSAGELAHRISLRSPVRELNELVSSFNQMAATLEADERDLKNSNAQLAELNRSYLDLVGFVSHELKGILSSAVMNAYAVRDGFLGLINFKQKQAMDSIARHLDYLSATVRNFLNLSRIEKGELLPEKRDLQLKEEVVDVACEVFEKAAWESGMTLVNAVPAGMKCRGDAGLLQVCANNLVGNAVKYGKRNGRIEIHAREADGEVEVEVFNEGRPLAQEEAGRLFKKFSRLEAEETRRKQGTGLGLFVTRQIVEKHGGRIRVEPRPAGNAFVFSIEKGEPQ